VLCINAQFRELEEEKQKKILDAAFDEFGRHGYKKASTNRIVKEAGISKGMLFYYFNNKAELYHDLIDKGVNCIKDEYLLKIDITETDFIERYKQMAMLKIKAYDERPAEFHFFGSLYLNPGDDVLSDEALTLLNETREIGFSRVYENIDTTLFRQDIPTDTCMRMIRWCLDGYERELTSRLKENGVWFEVGDFGPYWEEFYIMLDMLRTVYYDKKETK